MKIQSYEELLKYKGNENIFDGQSIIVLKDETFFNKTQLYFSKEGKFFRWQNDSDFLNIIASDKELMNMYHTDKVFHTAINTAIKDNLSIIDSLVLIIKCLHQSKIILEKFEKK